MLTFIETLTLVITLSQVCHGEYASGSVFIKDGSANYVAGELDKSAVAYGFYNNSLLSTGWGVLEIKAGYGPQSKNHDIMYAAGFLEGILTAEQIWNQYQNLRPFFLPKQPGKLEKDIRNFIKQQDAWSRMMISKHSTDPYWRHTAYILAQLDGLYDGYSQVAKHHNQWEQDKFVVNLLNMNGDLLDLKHVLDPDSTEQDKFVVYLLNMNGDLLDLKHVLDPDSTEDYSRLSKSQLLSIINLRGHCSALVKALGAFEDVFMSHSSWFTYSATNRIYKHYHLNVKDQATKAQHLSFSSYPGFLESLDDFYLLSSEMVLLQTTNNVFNTSLYKHVHAQSLFAWQRVRLANMMADSGKEWARIFALYNSGTYNNQYMVIDLKQIRIGEAILDDALWVIEQIPTLVESGDQTNILRTGYWPSYNVPFYESVYNLSGYPAFVEKHGLDFSYQMAPRAKIFRRDQANVKNMGSMKDIMRYNDYKHDPYSESNACNTICCRGDLVDGGARPDGCYDTKVSGYEMARNMQAFVINGPTLGTDLKPFSWTGPFANVSHVGLPETYNFGWYLMQPQL